MSGYDILQIPLVKAGLQSRWPQFLARAVALGGFLLAILAGLFGTPVGSRNFGIVFVWIAWWALLMLIAVPLFGRGWCSICPIPMPGEWLQQGDILKPGSRSAVGRFRRFVLGRRWPNAFRSIWIQNSAFALVALFSTVVLTQPRATALVLAGFLLVAVLTSLVFERRAFCRYLCPVGGFIGLYAQLAPTELRVKDRDVCAVHKVKTCYTGSAEGYGCPWQVFPAGLVKNTYCGTCMECLRTCPHDNIALNLRSFGSDLSVPSGRKLDEAYKAFIMLGSAIVYSAVLLGPWGFLKSAAYAVGSWPWLAYALGFLAFVFGLVPGLFSLSIALGRMFAKSRQPFRKQFIAFAYALVPLGLAAWIAFSLSFVLTNFSYVWPSLSDPLGWGWNLLGTAGVSWTPYLTGAIPALQAVVLLGGAAWAGRTARNIAAESLPAGEASRQSLPVAAFCLLVTIALLILLVG